MAKGKPTITILACIIKAKQNNNTPYQTTSASDKYLDDFLHTQTPSPQIVNITQAIKLGCLKNVQANICSVKAI